ncbi:MAG: hypothetical protein ACTSWC_07140 [Promethearchaeota archaeon]
MEMEVVEHKIDIDNLDPYEYYYHIERLRRILRSLEIYQHSDLFSEQEENIEKIVWKSGFVLKIPWASHLNSTLMDFNELGFDSHRDFYQIPKEKRDLFLKSHIQQFRTQFSLYFDQISPNEDLISKANNFYQQLRKDALNLSLI